MPKPARRARGTVLVPAADGNCSGPGLISVLKLRHAFTQFTRVHARSRVSVLPPPSKNRHISVCSTGANGALTTTDLVEQEPIRAHHSLRKVDEEPSPPSGGLASPQVVHFLASLLSP